MITLAKNYYILSKEIQQNYEEQMKTCCIRLQKGKKNIQLFIIQIMNDRKFENLRKKLDGIGCTQTLHPDSFDLVQKMYNLLYQQMSQVAQLKKKVKQMNSINHSSIDAQQHINNLISQKEALRKQLQQAQSGAVSKQNDQRIHKLTLMVNNFKIKLEESTHQYQLEVKKLTSEITSLQIRNSQLQKENNQLRSSSSLNSNQAQRYSTELTALVEKKSRQIRQLEDTNSKLRIRVQVLQRNIQQSKFAVKDNKEDSKIESDKLQQILKQQLSESQMRVRQLKTELQNTRDENDDLRRDLRRSRQEILILKKEQNNTRNIENADRFGKQKIEIMYSEAKQQLSQKIDQLKFAKDRLEEEEREKSKLQLRIKQLNTKTNFLKQKNQDLQTQIQHISSKSTLNIKRVRQLEASNASLEKQLKQIQSNSYSETKQYSHQESKQYQLKLQQLRKQAVIKDRQLKLFEEELKVLKDQGEQRAIERDKAQLQLKKLQGIVAQGSRNLQALQLQKEELMKENRQLRSGKQMLTSADSSAKSQIFLLREQIQARQGQLDQFRTILHAEQVRNKQLQTEIIRLQNVASKSEEKNRQIFEDNKHMAGRINVLEQRKNQLQEKVKILQERAHQQLEGTSESRKGMQQLKQKNEELLRQIAKKDQIIRIIDSEKDQFQNSLDHETQQRDKLKKQLVLIQKDIDRYGKNIQEREQTINDLSRKLSRSEQQRQNIERQHDRFVQENQILKDRLNSTERELNQVKNQLSLFVSSNKQIGGEAARLKNKIAELDKKLKDKYHQYEDEKQRATAMSVVSNELQAELQNQRKQTVRLNGFLRQLQDANNEMYQQLSRKDQELDEYSRIIEESERRQEQLIHQINSYQRQLQHLTQDFQSLQDEARRISGQKQFFKSERNWKKQVSSLAQDCNTKQEERYIDLQNDYHKSKKINEQLKQKCRHLQNLLSEERAENFRLNQNLSIPARTVLVQSRVQSYHEGENFNHSNIYHRSRHQSVPSVSDNISLESRQSQSLQAKESLEQIERRYMQTSLPNSRQTDRV